VRAWEREFVNRGTGSSAAISPTLDPIHQLTKECPDRRDSHPHRVVVSPRRPVLVGPWDAARRRRALSFALELRYRWRAANAHARRV